MRIDDAGERANKLVAAFILRRYRCQHPSRHLATCPEASVAEIDGGDGSYGCDTGCEYVRLEATITCPHERVDYKYGTWGELADILADLESEDPS